jgi:hypothetical protein
MLKKNKFIAVFTLGMLLSLASCENRIELNAPTNIRIINEELRWDANILDVFPEFKITINDSIVKTAQYNALILGGVLPLDFITESGEYTFEIQTVSNSITSGIYKDSKVISQTFIINLLSSVSFISYNLTEEKLTWNQVTDAIQYEVNVDGQTFFSDINQLSLPRKVFGGYVVKIRSIGNGIDLFNSSFSANNTFSFLSKPTNLSRDSFQIVWAAVPNASGYTIYDNLINIGQSTSPLFTLPSFTFGNVSITIKANGNNTTTFDSVMSDPLQFVLI